MRRVLFSIGSFRVYSYPALLYAGLVAGVFAGQAAARSLGLSRERFTLALVVLLVAALVGARLWFVLAHWPIYRHEPKRIWQRSDGGMAMYGGLLLSLALSPAVLALVGISFSRFWDAAAFTMLTGMAFTRIGCLLNGCCAGRPTRHWLSLRLPDQTGLWQRRYPTPILEALVAVVLVGVEVLMLDVEPFPGAVFLLAVASYSGARLALESLRVPRFDESVVLGPRVVSLALLAGAAVAFAGVAIVGGLR